MSQQKSFTGGNIRVELVTYVEQARPNTEFLFGIFGSLFAFYILEKAFKEYSNIVDCLTNRKSESD